MYSSHGECLRISNSLIVAICPDSVSCLSVVCSGNPSNPGSPQVAQSKQMFRLHDTHRLGLKLRQNFPVLNTGKKKKKPGRAVCSLNQPKHSLLPAAVKTLLPDKRKSNWEEESVSSKNLLFTPKSKIVVRFIHSTNHYWLLDCPVFSIVYKTACLNLYT